MSDQNQTQQVQQTLINELGLSSLSKEKQDELLARATEVVMERILEETMEKLSEADQETYAQMVEKKSSPEEIGEFLKGKIAGYDEMVKKIIEDFKEEMKATK